MFGHNQPLIGFLILLLSISYSWAQNFTNLDGNYTFKIPEGWNVMVSRVQNVDVMVTEDLLNPSDNIIVTTLGAGVPDEVYEQRETVINKLMETQRDFKAINIERVSVKDARNDLLVEASATGADGGKIYLAMYFFTMNTYAYSVGLTGDLENAEQLKVFIQNFLSGFTVFQKN